MNETLVPPISSPPQPKTSVLAIWSLVLGIISVVLSIICIGSIIAIPAIICGHMALSRIKRANGQLAGKGLAIAGFTTGYASLALLLLLLPIAIPNFVKARQMAQMNACISNLRQIDAAKNQWALANSKKGGDTPTESDLLPFFSNHQMPHCAAGGVYIIGAVTNPPTCSIAGHNMTE